MPTCCLTLNRKRLLHNWFYYSFSKFASDVQKATAAFWHGIYKSGPALGRLDRFDVTGPNAYGGPALMGDSRISNFYTKYAICYHTKLSYWLMTLQTKQKITDLNKQHVVYAHVLLITGANCFSLKWSQQNVSRRAINSTKKNGKIINLFTLLRLSPQKLVSLFALHKNV
jgi:hypothetical protein